MGPRGVPSYGRTSVEYLWWDGWYGGHRKVVARYEAIPNCGARTGRGATHTGYCRARFAEIFTKEEERPVGPVTPSTTAKAPKPGVEKIVEGETAGAAPKQQAVPKARVLPPSKGDPQAAEKGELEMEDTIEESTKAEESKKRARIAVEEDATQSATASSSSDPRPTRVNIANTDQPPDCRNYRITSMRLVWPPRSEDGEDVPLSKRKQTVAGLDVCMLERIAEEMWMMNHELEVAELTALTELSSMDVAVSLSTPKMEYTDSKLLPGEKQIYGHLSGEKLDLWKVLEGRRLEMKRMAEFTAYEWVPETRAGNPRPIGSMWLDDNEPTKWT